MAQANNFWTMRVGNRDRELIALLAQRAGCSASEAVRTLIREAVEKNEPRPKSSTDVAEARSFIPGP